MIFQRYGAEKKGNLQEMVDYRIGSDSGEFDL